MVNGFTSGELLRHPQEKQESAPCTRKGKTREWECKADFFRK